jgi:hypothetical protein
MVKGLSQILGGSAWIAISGPLLAGYGYPARANLPNFWDTPDGKFPLDGRDSSAIILTIVKLGQTMFISGFNFYLMSMVMDMRGIPRFNLSMLAAALLRD